MKIEAAHIIAEAEGGSNDEENGIPLCFDCHQEIGSYNDKHPRGNKIRPEELRRRRDRLYALVGAGTPNALPPANLQRLFERQFQLKTGDISVGNPTIAQVLVAVDKLDYRDRTKSFLILIDCAWENAFMQVCREPTLLFWAEYRDGATQLQYRTVKQVSAEAVKLMLLTYMHGGDELMRHAVEWKDITSTL